MRLYSFSILPFCILWIFLNSPVWTEASSETRPKNCSAVLSKSLIDIFDHKKQQIRLKFQGMKGYANFAELFYGGDMLVAFINASAVLGIKVVKRAGWQIFQGSVEEYRDLRNKILDSSNQIRLKFRGMEGYANFAKLFHGGDMLVAFIDVSTVLGIVGIEVLKRAGWQEFQGSVKEYRDLFKILDSSNQIHSKFQGMKGYANFAELFYGGDMLVAFINASAVLGIKVVKRAGWQIFQGSVEEYKDLFNKILDSSNQILLEYQGMEGLVQFAKLFYNGNTLVAFTNVSAVLGIEAFKKTGWQIFQSSVKKNRDLFKILDSSNQIRLKFHGMKGYTTVADGFYGGNMSLAFTNASAVLGIKKLQAREWKKFIGNTHQFYKLIEDFKNNYPQNYYGKNGQTRVARSIFEGSLTKSYKNVSSLRRILFNLVGIGKEKSQNKAFRNLNWE